MNNKRIKVQFSNS